MSTDISTRKILMLASNPKGTSKLRLDEEVREIENGLGRAKNLVQFELVNKWAVRPRDVHRALLDVNPDIVHFSGHGTGEEGLVFEDESGNPKLVTQEAMSGLFELFSDRIKCVVLNGCYSQVQAEVIARHIPCVIGMQRAIGDKAAIVFAIGFYDALGAGRSFEFAYKLGCVALQLENIPEHLTPILNGGNQSDVLEIRSSITLKQQIEEKLGVCFFDNLIRLVQKRVEDLSNPQAAYYTGALFTGVGKRFKLKTVEDLLDGQNFTSWFLLKCLSKLDLSRQRNILNHIEKDTYDSEGCNMLPIYDLIDAAGAIRDTHYYQNSHDRVFTRVGWELLSKVFTSDQIQECEASMQNDSEIFSLLTNQSQTTFKQKLEEMQKQHTMWAQSKQAFRNALN
jgi:CHAT domain